MRETIPLQILDPFSEFFEVGHTFSGHGSNTRIVVWLTPSRCVILLTNLPFFPCQCRRDAAAATVGD